MDQLFASESCRTVVTQLVTQVLEPGDAVPMTMPKSPDQGGWWVEPRGLEPLTPCLQSRCATNCAMAPR